QKMALDHATAFSKITSKQAEKMKEELYSKFKINKEVICEIINIMPNETEINLIAEKNKDINEENKKEILEIVNKYKKEKEE
ncbi:MAG: DNA-directed RNA polymerase subunit F, partial [archaeon]